MMTLKEVPIGSTVTIKKVCAEFELEVLDEDVEAFLEEELLKEEKNKALLAVDKKLLKRTPFLVIIKK